MDIHRPIPQLSRRLLCGEAQGLSPLPDGRQLFACPKPGNRFPFARHGDAPLAGMTPTGGDGQTAGADEEDVMVVIASLQTEPKCCRIDLLRYQPPPA
jgi:hypothetical protein